MKVLERLNSYKGTQLEKLNKLKEKYAINYNICDGLVSLKYNQLESPKTNPVVRECRGLILELDTFKVVCRQFHRFFNYLEHTEVTEADIPNMVIQEKHDGSLMSLYHHDGKWKCSTSGTPTASCNVGDWDMTFADLFWEAMDNRHEGLNESFTYTFELTAPQNKVVRSYFEPDIILLTTRNENQEEHSRLIVDSIAFTYGFVRPTIYRLDTIDNILDSWKELAPQEEGYVLVDFNKKVDGNFLRAKCKNPAYVALHRLKDSSCNSQRALLQVVLMGEVDEIITYFPEYTDVIRKLEAQLNNWKEEHTNLAERFKDSHPAEIGVYCKDKKINSAVIFNITRGQCEGPDGFIRNGIKKRGLKGFAKKFLNELKEW